MGKRMTIIQLILTITLVLSGSSVPAIAQKRLPLPFYDQDYVIGSSKAKVTVVEYASATCPHCARFAAEIVPAIKRKYVDTGRIKFVFREFLTEPADVAASSFIVARCSGKATYYKFVEDIFHSQAEMFSGNAGTEPVTVLMRIARAYGIDTQRFHTCLSDSKAVKLLGDRLDHAMRVDDVEGTPTILINGKKLNPGLGEWSMDVIGPAIDHALRVGK